MPLRVIAFSGNTHRPSRTRTLVAAVAAELSRLRPVDLTIYDLVDAGPGVGVAERDRLPLEASRIVEAIEEADALIVGSPVYKGSYAGLFKHLIDFVEPDALVGKPVVLTATGGGPRHALVVEHSLRPLFGFFAAQTTSTAVYAGQDEIRGGQVADPIVLGRVAAAANELDRLLNAAGVHQPQLIAAQ